MHNVEIYELKSDSFKRFLLFVQLFLTIGLFGVLIASIFVKNMHIIKIILYGILALLMLVMAVNNKNFYKRKYMTYIYLVISVILIISMVLEIL